jgi:Transcriptional regulators
MYNPDVCVFYFMNRVSKYMEDKMNERFSESGSTRVQWYLMYYLWRDGQMNQSDIGKKLDIKDSTVARLIDRMEKDGFVQRIKDTKDRRITYVTLTEKGRERVLEILPLGEEMSGAFAQNLSHEEIEALYKILVKLAGNVGISNIPECNI